MIEDVKKTEGLLSFFSHNSRKIIQFGTKIWEILKFDSSVVVMTAPDEEGARNVHCIDENGNKIWTVEEPEGVKGQANAFMNIWLTENKELWGGAWSGLAHQIDLETGKILSTKFTK